MIPAIIETNLTVSAREGTTLTASGTPHTEAASWTELIASTDGECQGGAVRVSQVGALSSDAGVLLDLAEGDVGGGSEVSFLTDLSVGEAGRVGAAFASQARVQAFLSKIAATKSVSARIRATIASETAVVAIALYQGSVHIEDVGAWTEYGISTAASQGTSVPLASGAWGAWTEIGTTSAAHTLFFPALDSLGDTSLVDTAVLCQIGYGASAPGSGGTAIEAIWQFITTAAEGVTGPFPYTPVYAVVGSGTKVWARLAGSNTDNRGVAIYGADGTVITAGGGLLYHPGMAGGVRG